MGINIVRYNLQGAYGVADMIMLSIGRQTIALAVLLAVAAVTVPGCGKDKNVLQSSGDPFAAARARITADVAGLQVEVENIRSRNFERPVATAVYSRSEYTAMVNSGMSGSSSLPEYLKEIYNRMFIRQGLLREGDDYYAESDAEQAANVAGFYREGSDTIVLIMPDDDWSLDLMDSVTIFHELIHALQDQRFGLGTLRNGISESDEYFAFRYTVEGEAKLLDERYAVRLIYGFTPPVSEFERAFRAYAESTDVYIDSRLAEGDRAFVIQPFYWQYWSYGPLFICAQFPSDTMAWDRLDDVFSTRLPVKTVEVMHPERYLARDRSDYIVDISGLSSLLNADYVWFDRDCLGEMLVATMLREWGIADYREAADGLRADRMLIFGNDSGTDLALYWYTYWDSEAEATEFVSAYRLLLQAKYGIVMPVLAAGVSEYDGTEPVVLKKDGRRVYVMENYPATRKTELLARLEAGTVSDWTTVAARTAGQSGAPYVSKDRLVGIYLGKRIVPFKKVN